MWKAGIGMRTMGKAWEALLIMKKMQRLLQGLVKLADRMKIGVFPMEMTRVRPCSYKVRLAPYRNRLEMY